MLLHSRMPIFPREGDGFWPEASDDALDQPDIAAAIDRIEDENELRLMNEGVSVFEFNRRATATGDDYPELPGATGTISLMRPKR